MKRAWAAALSLLLGQQSLAAAAAAPAARCLPGQDGFLSMRLRGSIEEEVRWTEPALDCAGMSRPDGRGLRVRFAGPLATGGELAIVFAAPALGMGASGRGVPVNVTLLDAAGERIFGTQGDSRCIFDEVEQRPIVDALFPSRSYRVSASGFCVAPARAVDGDGSVLLTRFDFAGLVTFRKDEGANTPAQDPYSHLAGLPQSELEVVTPTGAYRFDVWIAADDWSREQGLMHVRALPFDRGMLFLFERPEFAAFWMKDTYVSLDLVFIGPDGAVVNVAENTRPHSLEPIESDGPVSAVLELVAGTAKKIGLAPGNRIALPTLRTTAAPSERAIASPAGRAPD
ncbi:MAG: DUF192 domain-containing protein [Steroidobacteraceae bacterium]